MAASSARPWETATSGGPATAGTTGDAHVIYNGQRRVAVEEARGGGFTAGADARSSWLYLMAGFARAAARRRGGGRYTDGLRRYRHQRRPATAGGGNVITRNVRGPGPRRAADSAPTGGPPASAGPCRTGHDAWAGYEDAPWANDDLRGAGGRRRREIDGVLVTVIGGSGDALTGAGEHGAGGADRPGLTGWRWGDKAEGASVLRLHPRGWVVAPTRLAPAAQFPAYPQDWRPGLPGFVVALRRAGVRAEVVGAPEKTHSQIMQQFGLPDDTIAPAVFAFLRRVLSDATDPAPH